MKAQDRCKIELKIFMQNFTETVYYYFSELSKKDFIFLSMGMFVCFETSIRPNNIRFIEKKQVYTKVGVQV